MILNLICLGIGLLLGFFICFVLICMMAQREIWGKPEPKSKDEWKIML